MEKDGKRYIGYEYLEISAERNKASLYMDGYQNFGWLPDENQPNRQGSGSVLMKLKRDRKIINKTELTRLQQNFEDCMDQIVKMERSLYTQANIAAIGIGMTGTMCMAGSVFAITAAPPVVWLCVLFAVPGFAGWILPYFCYRMLVKRRKQIVEPLIQDKFDEIDRICEKGSQLLG